MPWRAKSVIAARVGAEAAQAVAVRVGALTAYDTQAPAPDLLLWQALVTCRGRGHDQSRHRQQALVTFHAVGPARQPPPSALRVEASRLIGWRLSSDYVYAPRSHGLYYWMKYRA
jgi:hypothetical protein